MLASGVLRTFRNPNRFILSIRRAVATQRFSSIHVSSITNIVDYDTDFDREYDYLIPTDSFPGIAERPFSSKTVEILSSPLPKEDIEILFSGVMYLPEIKYRRILNKAFGIGAWVILPRGPPAFQKISHQENILMVREYALFCEGRFVSQAIGEQELQNTIMSGMGFESTRSRALRRCCKDLGVGSELWDPTFVNAWRNEYASQVAVWNAITNARKIVWKKNGTAMRYPWQEERQ